jgi:hypothetical protein
MGVLSHVSRYFAIFGQTPLILAASRLDRSASGSPSSSPAHAFPFTCTFSRNAVSASLACASSELSAWLIPFSRRGFDGADHELWPLNEA